MRTIATVTGMRSMYCVRAVQTAMTLVEGIDWFEVTLGRVEVEHDGRATTAALRDAIAVAGFGLAEVREERRLPIVGG